MLRFEKLSFSYDTRKTICDISHVFDMGKLTIILGPNGSGKTTLLRLISGELRPQSGLIELNGKKIQEYNIDRIAQQVAYVGQYFKVEFDFTVQDIILMGRYSHNKKRRFESQQDIELAQQCMQEMGILHLKDRSILQISGGERQRVLLARALAQDCSILMLDEPIANLDIKYQIETMKLIRNLVDKKGITAICVLHQLELAANFADTVMVMKNGTLAGTGAPDQVLNSEMIKDIYGVDVQVENISHQIKFIYKY